MSNPESSNHLSTMTKRVPFAPVQPATSSTTPEVQPQTIYTITPEMQDAFETYKLFRRYPPSGRFNSVLYGSTKFRPYRVTPMPDEFYQPSPGLNGFQSRFIGTSNSPWSIFSGLPFAGVRVDLKINESGFGMTSFRTAHARPSPQQQIIFSYLCQSLYFEQKPPSYLTAQIYLCQNQLKSLVGDIIPQHFNVLKSPGKLELCSVLPFRFFCISASSDMPDMLKEGVVHALSQIHTTGVCLGNVDLSNFFIADNLKIFICDLTRATACVPNQREGISEAQPEDMLLEMRKLKFLLDYRDSRSIEFSRIVCASDWDRHARGEYFKQHLDETYSPVIPELKNNDLRSALVNLYSEDSWFKILEQRPRMYIPPHYDRATVYLALGRFSRSIGNTIQSPSPDGVEEADISTPRYDFRKRKYTEEEHEVDTPPTKRHHRDSTPLTDASASPEPTPHPAPSSQCSQWKHSNLHTESPNYQGMQPSIIENNLNPKFPPVVVKDFAHEIWFRKKSGPQVKFKSPTVQTFSLTSPPCSIPRSEDCDVTKCKKRRREEDSPLRPSLKRRRLDDGTSQETSDDDAGDSTLRSSVTPEPRRPGHRRRPKSRLRRLSAAITSFVPTSVGNLLYSWFGA